MPTLHFLPWCRTEKEHRSGRVGLIPFQITEALNQRDHDVQAPIREVLADFLGVDGAPIKECTLIAIDGQLLTDDYPDSATTWTISDYVECACLASLAEREFCGTAEPYSNSSCFALYSRGFRPGWGSVAPPIRRIDDTPLGLAGKALQVHIPVPAIAVPKIRIHEQLFEALSRFREARITGAEPQRWLPWREAMYCFDQANTDSEVIAPHAKWVLMVSAIERILDTKSNAQDFATRVSEVLQPRTAAAYETVHIWAKEFYRLRGQYAHGRLSPSTQANWNWQTHLLLGAIAFPLLVKTLLAEYGFYRPAEWDLAEVIAFGQVVEALRLDRPGLTKSWRGYVEAVAAAGPLSKRNDPAS
jgi:hypothetical protein